MKKLILTTTILSFYFCSFSQDSTIDRWEDNGDDTNITISEIGKININKKPQPPGYLEEIQNIKITDSYDFLSLKNATGYDNNFIPWLHGYNQSNNIASFYLSGITSYNNDVNSLGAIFRFDARKYYDGNMNSGGASIQNRPLFSWGSYTTILMQMAANGNLGIGTQIPTSQLHTTGTVRFAGIPSAIGPKILMADNDGNITSQNFAIDPNAFYINTNSTANTVQKLGIGNTLTNSIIQDDGANIGVGGAPTADGILTLYGTLHMMSDERTKTNIIPIENALEKVDQINGYYYDWKDKAGQTQVGLLAQEVEKVLPELVSENKTGTKFLNYEGIIPVLTEAIKEQQKMIIAQGIELESLKKEIKNLQRK